MTKNYYQPHYQALIHGKVITVDNQDSITEAVLIVDDKIAAVGSDEEILDLLPDGGAVVDLGGRTVIPGLIDGHVHAAVTANGFVNCVNVQYPLCKNLDEVFAAIRKKVKETPKGQWIRARGSFDGQNKLAEHRFPTRQELDNISTEHPIMVDFEVHWIVMNSYAIDLLGWTHESLIPKYGSMGRDQKTGEPTGLFTEVSDGMPHSLWGYDAWLDAMRTGIPEYYVANGVTSIHELPTAIDQIRAWQQLKDEGDMPLRVRFYPTHPRIIDLDEFLGNGLGKGFGDDWLRLGGIKLFIDGCGYHANQHPYCDLKWTQEELDETVYKIHAAGMQLFAHTLTPQGLEMAVKSISRAVKKMPRTDHRHRIEHAGDRIYRFGDQNLLYDTPQRVIEEMKEYGIIPIMTPQFMSDNEPHQGPPLRKMINQGLVFPGNTDSTGSELETANPWYGIWLVVTRKNLRGVVDCPEECLTPMEAIRMFTKWAAWGGFEENIKGSLEPGKLADLAVLDKDPLTCPPDELRTMPVSAVMIGGKWKFDKTGELKEKPNNEK